MKSEFNKSWNSSKQPRKQRKFVANAPNHIKRTLLGASLDKALRTKYGMRSVEVRKGDEVKVMRGKFAKKQGKVGVVDVKHTRFQVDGLQRAKMGGEKVETWFHPSNVKIIVLNVEDNKRLKRSAARGILSKKGTEVPASSSKIEKIAPVEKKTEGKPKVKKTEAKKTPEVKK